MRLDAPVYPVDRYLVESSNKMEMVNVTDDEIWNPAPAIRPEDEIMLRKLHDMLQSTADDLKLISGELKKTREPKEQVRTLPTPLDEEFNAKLHIEEIVNAKFNRHKFIDGTPCEKSQRVLNNRKSAAVVKPANQTVNASVQVNQIPTPKKASNKNNLAISHTKIVQIDEHRRDNSKDIKVNNDKGNLGGPFISYNEYSHAYTEPKIKVCNQKPLHIQEMPSINIRSELKEQKVLQLDIVPELKDSVTDSQQTQSKNVAVIALQYEPATRIEKTSNTNYAQEYYPTPVFPRPAVRRVSQMLTCESSESSNNVISNARDKIKTQKVTKSQSTSKPKNRNAIEKNHHRNLEEWKEKLNTIYGHSSTSRNRKTHLKSNTRKLSKKSSPVPVQKMNKPQNLLNNTEYIPYKKLTLGGIRVSDIEKEISELPDKNIPLSPILDKISTSRENSLHNSPRRKDENKNVFTTSDENLLEEVLEIKRKVSTTLSKNCKEKVSPSRTSQEHISSDNDHTDKDSYVDDFEDERTGNGTSQSEGNKLENMVDDNLHENNISGNIQTNIQNSTFTKSSTHLSFKDSVDIFEYVHSIDTQEHGTQSNPTHKLSLKATQTSPTTIQPIRNDLWPSENPKEEVNKSEDLVKKLIVDEFADILQKNLAKASTSKEQFLTSVKNLAASQKNTQTSPAQVKSVMTSPTKTKTRTTSPFALSFTVDRQTSPLVLANAEDLHIELDKIDDLAVSINLSSPRFSLRLPQNSRDVLSNFDAHPSNFDNKRNNKITVLKTNTKFSSTSSADGDYSSSDLSSLGEINNTFKRKLRKTKLHTVSESSASSVTSKYSSDISSVIIPLKSEGEISVSKIDTRKSRFYKSDGEISVGQTLR